MTIGELTTLLDAKRNAAGWTAKCPAHDDRTPSLSIGEGRNGGIVLCCHAGCAPEAICAALGITTHDLMPLDTTPRPPARNAPSRPLLTFTTATDAAMQCTPAGGSLAALYEYPKAGQPFGAVARYEGDAGKTFRQFHATPAGWTIGAPADKWPLFRAAELPPAGTIYICEGEKAALAALSIGLPPTTSTGGSKAAAKTDWTPLAGREIVIIPDNDEPGETYADTVTQILTTLTPPASVRIVRLPGLDTAGDIADYVQARPDQAPEAIRREIEAMADAAPVMETTPAATDDKPLVFLPAGKHTITAAGKALGILLAKTGKYYLRGSVVKINHDADGDLHLEEVKTATLASDFEIVAKLRRETPEEALPATCPEQTAKLITAASTFKDAIPPIHVLTHCPVLIERAGNLMQLSGYDRETGIYAAGDAAEIVSIKAASNLLHEVLSDFNFATPADHARALAAIITPALIFGGLLKARAPVDLGEADDSQSGKGYRNKLTAAIYRQNVKTVTQKKSGVGGLEESFNMALIRGSNFIALDNIRGRIDSPAIESFLTEDVYSARVPYAAPVEIDPRRVCLMLTSNKADVTPDLANRCSCVRILKRPPDYVFKVYPGGDILEHVRENQPRFLGAVFAIAKAWYDAGRPRTTETRHDFRRWAQSLDWIVQNLLAAAPLMDGHRETQARMTNPVLNWLRDLALEVIRAKQSGAWLRASDIVELLAETAVEVPALPEHGDLADSEIRKKAQQGTGRRLGLCFKSGDELTIDGMTIERRENYDQEGRYNVREYRFSPAAIQIQPIAANHPAIDGTKAQIPPNTTENPDLRLVCGYSAASHAAIETPVAAIAANTHLQGKHFDTLTLNILPIGTNSRIAATGAEITPEKPVFEEGEF